MRGTGATFRMLLKCMEQASAKDDQLILIIFKHRREAQRTHAMAVRMMMEAISQFVTFNSAEGYIDLKNGSRIMFKDPDYVERPGCVGLKLTQVVEDSSMEEITTTSRYGAMITVLRGTAWRNAGQ